MRLSVPCAVVVDVVVEFEARHRCPFADEADLGTVRIEWCTLFGETVELHALSALVSARCRDEISHEQWTSDICKEITSGVRVASLRVVSRWVTAGGTVTVSAS